MDAERVFRTAWFEFAQEEHLALVLVYRDVEVLDARETLLHLVQFVIVRGEEHLRMTFCALVDMLDDGPGDGDAVVGRGATSQLVEEH